MGLGKKIVAGVAVVGIAGGYVAYEKVWEPNEFPDFVATDVPFPLPTPVVDGAQSTAMHSFICPADAAKCNEKTALAASGTEAKKPVVGLKSINPNFIQAVVAIEDERFYSNNGCDVQAIGRALVHKVFQGRQEGGSGITRQYVSIRQKELNLRPDTSSLSDEKTECQIAMGLEQALIAKTGSKKAAKDVIIGNYVNTVFYGRNSHSPEQAAQQYFGTTAKKLTLPQSILLAGVINRPSDYDVAYAPELISEKAAQAYTNFAGKVKIDKSESATLPERQIIEAAVVEKEKGALSQKQHDVIVTYAGYRLESLNLRNRYNHVVDAMEKNQPKVVTPAKAAWLKDPKNFPLLVPYKPPQLTQVSFQGSERLRARHFTEFVVQEAQSIIHASTGAKVDRSAVLSGRYTIYTCLDARDQKALTNAVLSAPSIKGLDAAAVSLDPSGCIKAMVGSKDFNKVQTNIAVGRLGGGSGRSPGSSLKPYALATAIEQGLDPSAKLTIPASVTITQPGSKPWTVSGHSGCGAFNKKPPCQMTPGQLVAVSSNTGAVSLVKKYGIEEITNNMQKLGMEVPSPRVPALILGATAISPLDAAVGMNGINFGKGTANFYDNQAYSAITRIVDTTTGKDIYVRPSPERRAVFSPETAQATIRAMQQVVSERYGTAYGKITSPSGPKAWPAKPAQQNTPAPPTTKTYGLPEACVTKTPNTVAPCQSGAAT